MELGTLHIPRYTSKDMSVLLATMGPLSVLMNIFLFGPAYFINWSIFLSATAVMFFILGTAYWAYGAVALALRNRLPHDHQLTGRLALSIFIFIVMSGVLLSLVFRGYEYFGFLGYVFNENDFTEAYICLVIINVFLTFLNESIYKFESYKVTVTETEQLKKEYMHSQLLGLKSQVNPHFLFNSLNTLSSLICEDEEKAETFLDQMSKVYRYLLRSSDEQLVPLETELQFVSSYYHILKERHGDGLQLDIRVAEEQQFHAIPPLTLQMILENTMNTNVVSKENPLMIRIVSRPGSWLEVQHTVCCKVNAGEGETRDNGLENIVNKLRLLCQQEVQIIQEEGTRSIRLPLIPSPEKELV